MIKRFALILLIVLGFALLMQADAVYACTVTPSPLPNSTALPVYTLEDRINDADIVVIGTVINGATEYANAITIANVEVERYLKGDGAALLQISGFGDSALCRAGVSVGTRYIILARENANGTLYGSYFQGYSPLLNPTDENIEQIVAMTGQNAAPSSIGDTATEQGTNEGESFWLIVMTVVPVLVGLITGITMFFMRRDGRKSKAKRG